MTSHRTIVNTTCVKFNKICQPYPRVNTGTDTKASLRGVDKSDGPNNQKFKTGWKTVPVLTQLGTVNRRPMGLTSSFGVPVRILSDALADKANARNKVLHRGADEDLG